MTPGETGLWFGIIGGVAGILGTWLGGYLADRFGATNRRHGLTAPAIGMVVAAPLAFMAYQANSASVALASAGRNASD